MFRGQRLSLNMTAKKETRPLHIKGDSAYRNMQKSGGFLEVDCGG